MASKKSLGAAIFGTPTSSADLGTRISLPVRTESSQSFRDLLQSISGVQANRVALEALNAKQAKANKKGPVSFLFDQEKGILTAPARFGSALILDLMGAEQAFPELRDSNPLSSALRSARGDFAITGGDLPFLKIKKGDDFGTRIAKYAGALTFDFGTDPLSWVGGEGLISRKVGAEILTNPGMTERLIASAEKSVVEHGGNTGKLLENLFSQGGKGFVDAAEAAKEAVDPAVKKLGASRHFGNSLAEAFTTRGRGGVRASIESVFKEAGVTNVSKATDDFFRSLPDEIAGGLFLKNPITGRPIQRIAGGLGASNAATEAANRIRFGLSATSPARWASSNFGGKAGPLWAEAKLGLRKELGKGIPDIARTTVFDYNTFKRAMRDRGIDIVRSGSKSMAVVSNVAAQRENFTGSELEVFDNAFKSFFHDPAEIIDPNASAAYIAGRDAAIELRRQRRALFDEAVAAGIDINDLGDQYSTLTLTKAEREARALREGTSDISYSPTTGRKAEVYMNGADRAEVRGPRVEGTENAVYMSAPAANARLGAKKYEEDPIILFTEWADWASHAIANKRLSDALVSSGSIIRIPDIQKTIADEAGVLRLVEAISKSRPEAAAKLQQAVDTTREELNKLISPEMRQVYADRVAARKAQATTAYQASKQAEAAAKAELRAADLEVARLAPNFQQLQAEFQSYGAQGAEQQVRATMLAESEAKRLKKNATDRLRRANSKVEESVNLAALADEIGTAEDQALAAAGRDVAEAKAQREAAAVEEGFISLEQAQAELADARMFQEQASGLMTQRQMQRYQDYTAALERQVQAAAAVESAKTARLSALSEARYAMSDVSLEKATLLDGVVSNYVNARQARLQFERSIVGSVKKLPQEQAAKLAALREAEKLAKDSLEKIVGSTAFSPKPSIGREYARKVVELANKLSANEVRNVAAIADNAIMDNFLLQLADNPRAETTLSAVGDLYRVYERLRNVVPAEEFENIRKLRYQLETTKTVPGEGAEQLVEQGLTKIGAGAGKAPVRVPRAMRDVYASKGIRTVMEDLYKVQGDPTEWQKFINKVYDPLAFLWKTGATVGRGPAYVFTNVIGGLTNNFLGGVRWQEMQLSAAMTHATVQVYKDVLKDMPKASFVEHADEVARRIGKQFANTKVAGRNIGELFAEFVEKGGAINGNLYYQMDELRRLGVEAQTPLFSRGAGIDFKFEGEAANKAEEAFRKVVAFTLSNPYQNAMNDLAQLSEMYLRFGAVLGGMRKFGDMDSAMQFMMMLHFDYQDLSNAELWLKRLVPFYSWTRNNVPLQMRAIFMQSNKISKLMTANAELKNAFGVDEDETWINQVLPDYIDANGGFASYFKFAGNHIGLFPKLPIQDIDRLFQISYIGKAPVLTPRIEQAAQMLGPAVAPLEFLTKTNFDTGQQYDTYAESAQRVVSGLLPQVGTVGRLGSALSPVAPALANIPLISPTNAKDAAVTNLFNFILGAPYGAATLTEKSLKSGAINLSKEQNKQLRAAAEAAGVDLEWLKKQVRDGKSVADIRSMIAMGEGSTRYQEFLRQSTKRTPKEANFGEILGNLASGSYEYNQ